MFFVCIVGRSLGDSVWEKRQVWRSVDVWRSTDETKQEGQWHVCNSLLKSITDQGIRGGRCLICTGFLTMEWLGVPLLLLDRMLVTLQNVMSHLNIYPGSMFENTTKLFLPIIFIFFFLQSVWFFTDLIHVDVEVALVLVGEGCKQALSERYRLSQAMHPFSFYQFNLLGLPPLRVVCQCYLPGQACVFFVYV